LAAHGVAGGAMSEANGGSFKDGFVGGIVGAGISGIGTKLFGNTNLYNVKSATYGSVGSIIGRTAIASVTGGLASAALGGKFADGAYSAAFFHLFNGEITNIAKLKIIYGSSSTPAKSSVDLYKKNEAGELVYERTVQRSGRQFKGLIYAFSKQGLEHDIPLMVAEVVSGGYIEPTSHVTDGHDTSMPSGSYKVETTIAHNGKGIGFVLLDVKNRSMVEIHMNGVTTGCAAMSTEASWQLLKFYMAKTASSGISTVRLSVNYNMNDGSAIPHGNTGYGSGDPNYRGN
ncbi:MAG: hypothetical protein NTV80_04990, partial [Verrucomicrobia bacterium]|nr:hypothetical protein [Verrucomicrobiota bacterium]